MRRSCGILAHPTSLPGPEGVGTLGKEAMTFIDFLAEAGQGAWQVLPLGPTGFGHSPYASYSAFAGNPLMISCEDLVEAGLLEADEIPLGRGGPKVEFDGLAERKDEVLRKAFDRFAGNAPASARTEFHRWTQHPLTREWLDDASLFMAIRAVEGGRSRHEWEKGLRHRHPDAIRRFMVEHEEELWYHRFIQWIFARQWQALRTYAKSRGISLIGDIPIYVADDSADVWSHPEYFQLDEDGRPTAVAGVPPDYFSETGQLWGNPLYRWDTLAETGYAWWIARIRVLLESVDWIRLDHFRGFESYWAVPAGEKTAERGRWCPGPGRALFEALNQALGRLPFLAEDLGIITPEVEALRDSLDLPGMKILQFAFGGDASNTHLPHHHSIKSVVYTGTHDNDTTGGWLKSVDKSTRQHIREYLNLSRNPRIFDLIQAAYASVAALAVIPLQDALELGTSARMNTPSKTDGNWAWRARPGECSSARAERLRARAELYGRCPPRVSSTEA